MNTYPPMILSDEEYTELVDLIEQLEPETKRMNAASRSFFEQICERHEEFGRNIRISPRQWLWLRDMVKLTILDRVAWGGSKPVL